MNSPLCAAPLASGLDTLNKLQAAELDASVQDLLRTVPPPPSISRQSALPALAALPLSAQLNLLLLLRAAPHRFTARQRAALLSGLRAAAAAPCAGSGTERNSLLALLAAEVDSGVAAGAVPPCPDFLFSPQPCLPWAPVLADHATAAALHNEQLAAAWRAQLAELQAAQEIVAPAGPGKRPLEGQAADGQAKRQRPPVPPPASATTQTAGAADAQLEAAGVAVRSALEGHAGGGAGALSVVAPALKDALNTLLSAAAAGGEAGADALEEAGLGALADDSLLLLLLTELVTPASSFARCSAAAAGLLLPRLRALDVPAPRDLAAAVEHVGAVNPQAYIAACLRPLLSTPGLNKHQAELLSGTLKAALPPQLLPDVLAAACAGTAGTAGGGGWNEHRVGVLQAVLNAKPALGAGGVAALASAAAVAAASAELAASPKFAKLVLSVVKQWPAEASAAKAALAAAAAAVRSFMAKSLQAAVNKL